MTIYHVTTKMKTVKTPSLNLLNPKHQKLGEDDDDDDDPPALVTNKEAKKNITGLQHYFLQVGNDGSPASAPNTCADFVEMQYQKSKKQITLDSFLIN